MENLSIKHLEDILKKWFSSTLTPLLTWNRQLINKETLPLHTFSTLPLEITTEILKNLDWSDLLQMRKVCKRFDQISKTRTVWTNQYHLYKAPKKRPVTLEEPFESYSPEELEDWVLRRRSADLQWRRRKVKPVFTRQIKFGSPCGFHLIRGGRWLLVGGNDGSVTSYDLDDSQMRNTVLIGPRDQRAGHITVDIDETTPNLSFNLAVSPTYNSRVPRTGLDIVILNVALSGHGRSAVLLPIHQESFSAAEPGSVGCISLRGRLIARLMSTPAFRTYIEVFDWTKSTSCLHRRKVIFPDEEMQYLHILPGNRLLATSHMSISIYDIATMANEEPITPIFPATTSIPQWKLPINGTVPGEIRQCMRDLQSTSDDQATYLVLNSGQIIHGFIVPHDVNQSPHLVDLLHLPKTTLVSYNGLEKVAVSFTPQLIDTISVSWDISAAERCVIHTSSVSLGDLTLMHRRGVVPLCLDEETGRIVIRLISELVVLDTSPYFMSDKYRKLEKRFKVLPQQC